jgi:hypothetical protein
MTPEAEEYSAHWVKIAKSLKIDPEAFTSWLQAAPESTNIVDRREGQSNSEWLREVIQDHMRLGHKPEPNIKDIEKGPKETEYVEGLNYPGEWISQAQLSSTVGLTGKFAKKEKSQAQMPKGPKGVW